MPKETLNFLHTPIYNILRSYNISTRRSMKNREREREREEEEEEEKSIVREKGEEEKL